MGTQGRRHEKRKMLAGKTYMPADPEPAAVARQIMAWMFHDDNAGPFRAPALWYDA